MAQENIDASRRLIEEAFGGGNLDLIDELCSEDFVGHDPLSGDQDREAAKQSIAGYREAFPDLRFTVDDIVASDDKVAIRWTGEGTFENEFMGLQPTHERGNPVHGISIDRYANGKLVETWNQWDTMTLLRDLGALPEEASVSS